MFADIVRRNEREAAFRARAAAGRGQPAAAAAAAAAAEAGGGPSSPKKTRTVVDVSYWGFFKALAPGGAASLVAATAVLMAEIAAGWL